jgi:hypothetical protein
MQKIKTSLKTALIITGSTFICAVQFYLGMTYGEHATTKKFHQELIDRGLAEYNTRTGIWQYAPNHEMQVAVNDDLPLMPSIIPTHFPTKKK